MTRSIARSRRNTRRSSGRSPRLPRRASRRWWHHLDREIRDSGRTARQARLQKRSIRETGRRWSPSNRRRAEAPAPDLRGAQCPSTTRKAFIAGPGRRTRRHHHRHQHGRSGTRHPAPRQCRMQISRELDCSPDRPSAQARARMKIRRETEAFKDAPRSGRPHVMGTERTRITAHRQPAARGDPVVRASGRPSSYLSAAGRLMADLRIRPIGEHS